MQSAHKTLPSLTQTAFLQLNGDLADPAEVERQLDVFETSSPSYPLMVSLDGCTRWLADEGEAAFAAWRARLDAFDAAVRDLKNTKILCCGADALTAHPDFFAHDSGKILLQIGAAGAAYLRADGFEPEMVCGPNVLAMTSPCDDADALERLAKALPDPGSQAITSGEELGELLCARCANRELCWGKGRVRTERLLADMMDRVERGEAVDEDNLPRS